LLDECHWGTDRVAADADLDEAEIVLRASKTTAVGIFIKSSRASAMESTIDRVCHISHHTDFS
jgi:hypothetical protein